MINKEKNTNRKRNNIFLKVYYFFKNLFLKEKIYSLPDSIENIDKNTEVQYKNLTNINESTQNSQKLYTEIESEYIEDYMSQEELDYRKIYDDSKEITIEEKERFFKLYNNIKNKNIGFESLNNEDLFKVNQMLKLELMLREKKMKQFKEI